MYEGQLCRHTYIKESKFRAGATLLSRRRIETSLPSSDLGACVASCSAALIYMEMNDVDKVCAKCDTIIEAVTCAQVWYGVRNAFRNAFWPSVFGTCYLGNSGTRTCSLRCAICERSSTTVSTTVLVSCLLRNDERGGGRGGIALAIGGCLYALAGYSSCALCGCAIHNYGTSTYRYYYIPW